MRLAEAGIQELQKYVDTLINIPNQKSCSGSRMSARLSPMPSRWRTTCCEGAGVGGVTDLMVKPGLINLDFADIAR